MRIDLNPKVNRKSIGAGVGAGVTALLYALDGGVTGNETLGIIAAALVPLGVVWAVPNAVSVKRGAHVAVPPDDATGT